MTDLLKMKRDGIDAEGTTSLNVYLRRGDSCLWRDEFGDELLALGVVAFAEVSLVNTILEDGQLSFQGVPNSVCVMITHQINSKINEKINALIARAQTRDDTVENLRVFLQDVRQQIKNSTLFTFSQSSSSSLFPPSEDDGTLDNTGLDLDDDDEEDGEEGGEGSTAFGTMVVGSEIRERGDSSATKHSKSSSKKKGLQASIFKFGRDAKRQSKKLNNFASAVCDVVSKHTKEGVDEIKQAYDNTMTAKKKKGR